MHKLLRVYPSSKPCPDQQLHINLTRSEKALLRALAAKRGVTLSGLVRELAAELATQEQLTPITWGEEVVVLGGDQAEPIEVQLVEAEPIEVQLVEAEPIEVQLVEAEPIEVQLVEAEPIEVHASPRERITQALAALYLLLPPQEYDAIKAELPIELRATTRANVADWLEASVVRALREYRARVLQPD